MLYTFGSKLLALTNHSPLPQERRLRCGRVNDVLNQFRNLLRPPWPEKGNALTSAFKHVVVFGELNFRVEMPRCVNALPASRLVFRSDAWSFDDPASKLLVGKHSRLTLDLKSWALMDKRRLSLNLLSC